MMNLSVPLFTQFPLIDYLPHYVLSILGFGLFFLVSFLCRQCLCTIIGWVIDLELELRSIIVCIFFQYFLIDQDEDNVGLKLKRISPQISILTFGLSMDSLLVYSFHSFYKSINLNLILQKICLIFFVYLLKIFIFSIIKMRKKIIKYIENYLLKIENSPKPILKLFLKGIKGRLEITYTRPYNFYITIASIIGVYAFAKYLVSFRENQMNVKGYNWFVPDYVYRVRQQSYVYWEISRLAKKLPTTFTFYQWDQNLMYQIDRSGEHKPFHAHKGLQNTQTFTSPLHQYNFPASAETHGRIIMYLKNLKNPYDLKNYLRYKPITFGDWLRAFYYGIYRELGLTNRWRYDEYVSKPDFIYQFQKLKYAYLLSKDRDKLYETLDELIRMKDKTWSWRSFFWMPVEQAKE